MIFNKNKDLIDYFIKSNKANSSISLILLINVDNRSVKYFRLIIECFY